MKDRLLRVLFLLVFSLFVFMAFRIAIFFHYNELFEELTTNEVLRSFVTGLRVDVITIFTFFSPLVFLVIFPHPVFDNKHFQKSLLLIWFALLVLMAVAMLGDFIYFQHVHRHSSNEVFLLSNDAGVLWPVLIGYWQETLIFIFLLLCGYLIFIRIDRLPISVSRLNLKTILVFLLVFFILAVGVRGRIKGKPFGIVDAFSSDNVASGNLALNGIYSVYRSSTNEARNYHFMPHEEALVHVKSLLADDRFEFVADDYPLMRRLKKQTHARMEPYGPAQDPVNFNVVIILLESWSLKYVDSFSGNSFGVTPNFDALANQGVKFTNFYSNGQRSIDGITALLTGIPRVNGISYLGSGLELSEISYLGDLAKKNGYYPIAMQSSKRTSYRVDSIARLSGFEEYYGAEDIPARNFETSGLQPYFGTWDNNMFQFFLERIDSVVEAKQKPFLAFAFTSTTHAPFYSPGKEWEKFEHDDTSISGYLNTLYYADDVLGNFMEDASQKAWFDQTIFIFMADHALGMADKEVFTAERVQSKKRSLENMRIPLLIYSPVLFVPAEDTRITSQADILPTLVELLSWEGQFTSISQSIFSTGPRFALLGKGSIVSYVDEHGFVEHGLGAELKNKGKSASEDAKVKTLAIYQSMITLLRKNKFFKEKGGSTGVNR